MQRQPGAATKRSRTLSAQDRKFIAETEAVAHMKLDEPGLDVSQQGVAKSGASFWHRSTTTASAPKHRTVTAVRQLAAQAQKQGGSHQQDLFMVNTSQFEAGVIHAAEAAMILDAGIGVAKIGIQAVRLGASGIGLFRATATGTMKSQAGEVGVESAVNVTAKNHISGLRLQQQLAAEEQQALFNSTGGLSQEAIKSSRLIIQGDDLGNAKLINDLSSRPGNLSDWGKYVTEPIHTPSGSAQVHFYHNPVTNDVYYGRDYKSIFDHQGTWNMKPNPNFDYEPPRFR